MYLNTAQLWVFISILTMSDSESEVLKQDLLCKIVILLYNTFEARVSLLMKTD